MRRGRASGRTLSRARSFGSLPAPGPRRTGSGGAGDRIARLALSLLRLIVGFAALVFGADLLVRGAAGLALRIGLGPLVVGLTVVAFGTSAPELAVSLRAGLSGSPGIAYGNVVGSNIANVALILGVAALLCPLRVHHQVIRREMPVMLLASVALVVFLRTGEGLARGEAALLLGAGLVHVTWTVLAGLRREGPTSDGPPAAAGRVPIRLLQFAAGLAVLLVGADQLVSSAVSVARHVGMSEALIGVTIVAIGTSAPELATSVVAALRKEADIAVGNVVGSNVFNVLVIAGLTGALAPGGGAALGPLDLGFLVGTAVLLLPMMATRFTIDRREGALLLASYVAYLALLGASAS